MSSRKSKNGRGKAAKLPEGSLGVPITQTVGTLTTKGTITDKTEQFCDNLLASDWQPLWSRPKHDVFGFYVICRWYACDQMWVIIYVGRGFIRNALEAVFSGKQRSPIGQYLSSFAKADRNLVWTKWMRDPYYPYESLNVDHVLTVVREKYNGGENPAFNLDGPQGTKGQEDELPEDFSIVPNWHKLPRKKKAADKSS